MFCNMCRLLEQSAPWSHCVVTPFMISCTWCAFMKIFKSSSLQSSFTSHEHSVVWRRLRLGWVRSVGGTHRRLATARADMKAAGELAWTMLLLSLFQAIIVGGKKDCLYCSVLQLGIVRQQSWLREMSLSFYQLVKLSFKTLVHAAVLECDCSQQKNRLVHAPSLLLTGESGATKAIEWPHLPWPTESRITA